MKLVILEVNLVLNDQKTELCEIEHNDILRLKDGNVVCKEHPTYMAIHSPRKDCPGCWELYNIKNKDTNKE